MSVATVVLVAGLAVATDAAAACGGGAVARVVAAVDVAEATGGLGRVVATGRKAAVAVMVATSGLVLSTVVVVVA